MALTPRNFIAPRITYPPSNQSDMEQWLRRLATQFNTIPPTSTFSGQTPGSETTARPGTIATSMNTWDYPVFIKYSGMTSAGWGPMLYSAFTSITLDAGPSSLNNHDVENYTIVQVNSSTGLPFISGFSSGFTGRRLTLVGAGLGLGADYRLRNEDTNSIARNRVITSLGTNVNVSDGSAIELLYYDSRWRVVSFR